MPTLSFPILGNPNGRIIESRVCPDDELLQVSGEMIVRYGDIIPKIGTVEIHLIGDSTAYAFIDFDRKSPDLTELVYRNARDNSDQPELF